MLRTCGQQESTETLVPDGCFTLKARRHVSKDGPTCCQWNSAKRARRCVSKDDSDVTAAEVPGRQGDTCPGRDASQVRQGDTSQGML